MIQIELEKPFSGEERGEMDEESGERGHRLASVSFSGLHPKTDSAKFANTF